MAGPSRLKPWSEMLSLDPSVEEVGKQDLASARGQELEPCEVNDLPVG